MDDGDEDMTGESAQGQEQGGKSEEVDEEAAEKAEEELKAKLVPFSEEGATAPPALLGDTAAPYKLRCFCLFFFIFCSVSLQNPC